MYEMVLGRGQGDHSPGSSGQGAQYKEFKKRQQGSMLLVFLQPSSATLWQVGG